MAPPLQRKRLALDTNILFDLAKGIDAAHDFREVFLSAKYDLRIPPTAFQELVFASEDEEADPEDRQSAANALANMVNWGTNPFDLIAVGHGLTDGFAEKLLKKGLLPETDTTMGLFLRKQH